MKAFSDLWKRLAPGVASRHAEEELDEEIRDHIDRLVHDLILKGVSPEEAEKEGKRLAVRLGAARAPIALEDQKGIMKAWLEETVTAAGVTFRASSLLMRRRKRSLLALVFLYAVSLSVGGAGIGFGWSVLNWLPHAENASSIRRLYRERPNSDGLGDGFSYDAAQAISWSARFPAVAAEFFPELDSLGGFSQQSAPKVPVKVSLVSSRYFDLFGVQAYRGSLFSEGDPAGEVPPAVLSWDLWQRLRSDRSEIVGDTVELGGIRVAAIGVLPRRFRGVNPSGFDLVVPLLSDSFDTRVFAAESFSRPTRPGASLVRRISAPKEEDLTELEGFLRERSRPFHRLVQGDVTTVMEPGWGSPYRFAIYYTMAVAGLVLLLAVATVRGILILDGMQEARRKAVTRSLGATRFQLATPGMVFNLVALTAGLLIAWYPGQAIMEGTRTAVLSSLLPPERLIPTSTLLSIMVALGLAFLTVGALTRGEVFRNFALLRGGRSMEATRRVGTERALSGALALQLIVAGALLTLSGLLYRGWTTTLALDLGFDAEETWVFETRPAELQKRGLDASLLDTLAHRIALLPEVEGVTWSPSVPARMTVSNRVFRSDQSPVDPREGGQVLLDLVESDYFRAIGLEIVRGRGFPSRQEDGGIVVNRTLAHHLDPGGDPVGQCLRVGDPGSPCQKVVGVVEDVPRIAHAPPSLKAYVETSPDSVWRGSLLARVAPGADPGVRERFERIHKSTLPWAPEPVTVQESYLSRVDYQRTGYRFLATISALSLLLAGVGVFGLYSLKLARSTEEVALRYALGAPPGKLAGQLVAGAIVRLIPPLAIVSLFLFAGASTLRPLLPGTNILDPGTLLLAIALMVGITLSAVALPVRNTLLVDPAITLKADR